MSQFDFIDTNEKKFNRRDFLKAAALTAASVSVGQSDNSLVLARNFIAQTYLYLVQTMQ